MIYYSPWDFSHSLKVLIKIHIKKEELACPHGTSFNMREEG